MSEYFGLNIFAMVIFLTASKSKSAVAVGKNGLKAVPSCGQIKSMRAEINNIFIDTGLHTSALRLGKNYYHKKEY